MSIKCVLQPVAWPKNLWFTGKGDKFNFTDTHLPKSLYHFAYIVVTRIALYEKIFGFNLGSLRMYTPVNHDPQSP